MKRIATINAESLTDYHRAFLLVSRIATVFACLVCLILLVRFAVRVVDPSVTPRLVELKQSLRAANDDEATRETIREEIRTLDMQSRVAYFDRREFARVGAWLLLGAVCVAVSTARTASTIQRRAPAIPSATAPVNDPSTMESLQSITAVIGFAVGVFLFSSWLIFSDHSVLPRDAMELAALFPDDNPGPTVVVATSVEQVVEPVTDSTIDSEVLPKVEEHRQQWTRFRGNSGDGIATESFVPPAFDVASGEGIRWKMELELPGNNSPIVCGDHVLLSGATEDRRCVYCYAASNGELRWQTEIPITAPEQASDEHEAAELTVNEETGYAAPTMATDGVRVFVMFAHGDVTALDFKGKILWTRSFSTPHNHYGHAASLVVDETQLIVQLDHGSSDEPLSKLMALNCRTGKTLWSTPREVPASWSTPLVIEYDNETQIITCANPWVIAYRASDGEELWRCDALYQDVGPSPIARDGVLYVANENPGGTAIRLGGSGDVTETHVVWMIDYGIPDTTSPLLVGDMILMLPSFGTLTSYDIATGGDPLWEVDFDDSFRSSPTFIGEHVLLIGVSGKVWLITVTREGCETVMQSDLGENCLASPAVHGGRIFIRGQKHLFCVGES